MTQKQANRTVYIGKNIEFEDPLLSKIVLDDAKRMTYIYGVIYIFENSLREVIRVIMTKKYGSDWWEKMTNPKIENIKKKVKSRKEDEKKNPWHGERGDHQLCYIDMGDLNTIFEEFWADFESLFPNKNWLITRVQEISRSRNIVDHHNPLSINDQERITIYFKDWFKQVNSIKYLLI